MYAPSLLCAILTLLCSQIRACLMSNEPVQDWLQDGASYGEQGLLLDLDSLFVRAASIQSRCSRAIENGALKADEVYDLAQEAINLDFRLVVWVESLPLDWKLHSQDQTVVWIRCYAVRLMLNDWMIRLHLLSPMCASSHMLQVETITALDQTIATLADDICISSRAFFQIQDIEQQRRDSGLLKIEARMAAVLTWPLALTLKSTFLGKEHRLCATRMMEAVKRALGAPGPT